MPKPTIIKSNSGKSVEYASEQVALPALPVDALIHVYTTPNGLWVGAQEPGKPRPVYPGAGGKCIGIVELPADEAEAEKYALATAKQNARHRINDAYQADLNAVLSDYPDAETKTWEKQETEAREWQANSIASTPMIDALCEARQMDKAELVHRVIAKADTWIALSGAATGKRQRLEDAIEQAQTVIEVDAIAW